MSVSYYQRMTRKLGPRGTSDDFDQDSGVTHRAEYGITLCGVPIGTERLGWFRNNYAHDDEAISCRRCQRAVPSLRGEK